MEGKDRADAHGLSDSIRESKGHRKPSDETPLPLWQWLTGLCPSSVNNSMIDAIQPQAVSPPAAAENSDHGQFNINRWRSNICHCGAEPPDENNQHDVTPDGFQMNSTIENFMRPEVRSILKNSLVLLFLLSI